MVELKDCYQNNSILIKDFQSLYLLKDKISHIRININLEIMKYEVAEKIFNATDFKLDLHKRILYLHRFDNLTDGFIKVYNSVVGKDPIFSQLLTMYNIFNEYGSDKLNEYCAGRFIVIETKFL